MFRQRPRASDLEVVRERDQPPAEHPRNCSRKWKAVTRDVCATLEPRPNMRGLDFRMARVVVKFKAADRAPMPICLQYLLPEQVVPDLPIK